MIKNWLNKPKNTLYIFYVCHFFLIMVKRKRVRNIKNKFVNRKLFFFQKPKPTTTEGCTSGQVEKLITATISIPLKDKQTKVGACSQWQMPHRLPWTRRGLGRCRLRFRCLPTKYIVKKKNNNPHTY